WALSGEWLGTKLLRRSGVGLFFLVLFFNAHLILGFLNFLLGTAACFLTFALLAHMRSRRAQGTLPPTPLYLRVSLGLALLATFYFHVVPFAMAVAVLVVVVSADVVLPRVRREYDGRHALPIWDYIACVPALLALVAWLFSP